MNKIKNWYKTSSGKKFLERIEHDLNNDPMLNVVGKYIHIGTLFSNIYDNVPKLSSKSMISVNHEKLNKKYIEEYFLNNSIKENSIDYIFFPHLFDINIDSLEALNTLQKYIKNSGKIYVIGFNRSILLYIISTILSNIPIVNYSFIKLNYNYSKLLNYKIIRKYYNVFEYKSNNPIKTKVINFIYSYCYQMYLLRISKKKDIVKREWFIWKKRKNLVMEAAVQKTKCNKHIRGNNNV